MTPISLRPAEPADIPALTRLWFAGWQDAHAAILPAKVARHRTFDSFGERLQRSIQSLRVAGALANPDGFSFIKGDELYQFYVHERARGGSTAAALMKDAEARFSTLGIGTAWLACAIGNDRAARFYEKSGWRHAGNMTNFLDLPDGQYPLEVWRYEKVITVSDQS